MVQEKIKELETQSRQTGRTTALVLAARAVKNSVFVTLTLNDAKRIRDKFGIKTIWVHDLDKIEWHEIPFYDHTVLAYMDFSKEKQEGTLAENLIEEERKALLQAAYKSVNRLSSLYPDKEEVNDVLRKCVTAFGLNQEPKEFASFEDLKKDIIKQAKDDDCVCLLSSDDPLRLQLGWVDVNSGKCWRIGVSRIQQYIDTLEGPQKETMKVNMSNQLGKLQFAGSFSEECNRIARDLKESEKFLDKYK